ncbi:hypothetical protein LX32DRAFT_296018 [Colletotrichum zoysiae]|uniref:Uncharacterized protein n=1 Tax=Colletotrichum zoysiae TaxID=1216348 RepID=A0AAD9HMF8_9PEZI|nr:hypothetical protein LX32DRAFT_296018 [Colletotrichum zoysiae]
MEDPLSCCSSQCRVHPVSKISTKFSSIMQGRTTPVDPGMSCCLTSLGLVQRRANGLRGGNSPPTRLWHHSCGCIRAPRARQASFFFGFSLVFVGVGEGVTRSHGTPSSNKSSAWIWPNAMEVVELRACRAEVQWQVLPPVRASADAMTTSPTANPPFGRLSKTRNAG